MSRHLEIFRAAVAIAVMLAPPLLIAQAIPPPPASPAIPSTTVLHGVTLTDRYQWLENRSSADTSSWIAAQQRYTAALLTSRPGMDDLRRQIRELVDREEPHRVLYRHGDYFLERKPAGGQFAGIYLRHGASGQDNLLLGATGDEAASADTVELLNVAADGKLVAYGVRHGGRDQLSIHFRDLATGRDLASDTLPEARYLYWSLPIAPDRSAVFYVKFDENGPRIYRHRFGHPVTSDDLLFGQDMGPSELLAVSLSPDGRWLLATVLHGASGSTDLWLKDLESSAPFTAVVTGIHATFNGAIAGHTLFIETDWKAGRGQVFSVPVDHPEQSQWKVFIPERQDFTIQTMALTGNRLILNTIHDAHSELTTYTLDGKPAGVIPLPGVGSVATVDPDPDSPLLSFSYTSFQTPSGFYAWTPGNGVTPIDVPPVPAGLRDIVVDQVWYRSTGGVRVPMFLAHRRALVPDGHLPVLLYGYGGFNWAQLPAFSAEVAAWLDRGGVYAVANIRGGDEFGEAWHRAGELDEKQNCFDDFANAARWLISNHYTSPDRLAIEGLSNGGLLVMTSITQHPELFGAVIGRYSLIDMMRYERFTIARWWVSEYGSVSDPVQFRTLLAYSPYEHVVKGTAYPAVLLVTGDGDTRVDPSHSRKMTAMLQNATSSGKPVLLLYDSTSGHSGSLSADAEVEQTANELEFLDWQLQIPESFR
ncbi:MAG TPA: prolyl oligopeptidase family serine peptidase [Terracidiphilus sp.]|jgi:prolyl oligopeptidase